MFIPKSEWSKFPPEENEKEINSELSRRKGITQVVIHKIEKRQYQNEHSQKAICSLIKINIKINTTDKPPARQRGRRDTASVMKEVASLQTLQA